VENFGRVGDGQDPVGTLSIGTVISTEQLR